MGVSRKLGLRVLGAGSGTAFGVRSLLHSLGAVRCPGWWFLKGAAPVGQFRRKGTGGAGKGGPRSSLRRASPPGPSGSNLCSCICAVHAGSGESTEHAETGQPVVQLLGVGSQPQRESAGGTGQGGSVLLPEGGPSGTALSLTADAGLPQQPRQQCSGTAGCGPGCLPNSRAGPAFLLRESGSLRLTRPFRELLPLAEPGEQETRNSEGLGLSDTPGARSPEVLREKEGRRACFAEVCARRGALAPCC